jgi:iron complex outermembrane recepter protein
MQGGVRFEDLQCVGSGRSYEKDNMSIRDLCVFGLLVLGSPPLQAAEPSGPTDPAKDVVDMDLAELVKVRVSPFEVSTRFDNGYSASNSVSGSRFDAPIRELPFAIQAFTQSFIKDQQPRDIFDIARYSPGVTYRSNDFNEGNANLAIRGFAVSSVAGGNIAVMRDGFHGPSIFDFTNISRVEVVKGPASFLYGQVAPGGIVNIITKSPRPELAASIDARYGSYGQYRFDADVTGPLLKNLFFRLPASSDQDSHYWKPYDAHSWDIAPSLLWQPLERVSVTLKYEHFSKNETPQLMQKPGYNTQAGVVPTAADPNLSGVDVPGLPDNWNSMSAVDYRRSTTNSVSGWVDIRASDHWNLRAGYSHVDYKIDALWSGNLGMANNTTLLQGRRFRRQTYYNVDDTGEAQAVGKYAFSFMSLRLLLGAQYIDRHFDQWAAQAPNDPALGSNPTASPLPLWDLSDPSTWNRDVTIPLTALTASAYDQTDRNIDRSAYAGTTFGFFEDRLLVLAGWRLTSTRSHLVNNMTSETTFQKTVSAVTPQYGALYKLTPGLSLFGSYSESFVPNTNLLYHPDGTYTRADPSRGQGIDLGLKADLLGGRASGTLNYFDIRNHNIVNDLATTDSSGSVSIYHVQSGEQRSRGVELDATIKATENWQIYLSYSYMDARITEFSGNDAAILAQDPALLDAAGQANYKNVRRFHNAPLQMSAPQLANLWTRYDLTWSWLRGVYVAGGFNFVYDQTLLPDTPTWAHQTYTLLNALLGYGRAWRGHRMDLSLMGKNLADQHYRPSQSTRGRPLEILLRLAVHL